MWAVTPTVWHINVSSAMHKTDLGFWRKREQFETSTFCSPSQASAAPVPSLPPPHQPPHARAACKRNSFTGDGRSHFFVINKRQSVCSKIKGVTGQTKWFIGILGLTSKHSRRGRACRSPFWLRNGISQEKVCSHSRQFGLVLSDTGVQMTFLFWHKDFGSLESTGAK